MCHQYVTGKGSKAGQCNPLNQSFALACVLHLCDKLHTSCQSTVFAMAIEITVYAEKPLHISKLQWAA